MKIKPMIKQIGTAISAVLLLAVQAGAEEPQVLKNPQERQNYSMGVDIARSLKRQAGEVNLDLLLKGLKDELMGEKLLLNEEELHWALSEREAKTAGGRNNAAVKEGKKPEDTAGKVADSGTTQPGVKASPGSGNDNKQANQLAAKKVEESVAKRYEKRRETRARATELRRKAIERELQGNVQSHSGI